MKKYIILISTIIIATLAVIVYQQNTDFTQKDPDLRNPLIDQEGFVRDVLSVTKTRESRRVSLNQFLRMAKEPNTIILDSRSTDKFINKHIKGSRHLSYTDFTESALSQTIPSKNTRVLIYCNNNFMNNSDNFASKAAPAALNLSTMVSLASYGYHNVYELAPVLNEWDPRIPFESLR